MRFLTNEQNDSSHMAYADTYWFACACVKPNQTKGKMQMSSNSPTDSDQINQTPLVGKPVVEEAVLAC